jgi:hypothetical protein
MKNRLGLGFEEKSDISPSTQDARAFFLELIPQFKQEVVSSLFESARQPFLEFLTHSRDEILSISRNLSSPIDSTDTAIRLFISGWSVLRRHNQADALCHAMQKWSNTWHLTADWCLDHALATLREQHLVRLSSHEAWQEAIALELKLNSICTQDTFAEEFRKRRLDTFSFRYETIAFTVEGPTFKSPAQFRQEVEQKFKDAKGESIRSATTAPNHQVDEYFEKVNKVAKELGFTKPPFHPAAEHFEWVISYQIPPVRRYREIGRDCGKDEKTIREGIQDVATLIGLPLRSSEGDKSPGRPKGAKDKAKRFRSSSK